MKSKKDTDKDEEEIEKWRRKKEEKEIEKYGVTLEEMSHYDIKKLNKISKTVKKFLLSIWIIGSIIFASSIIVTIKFILEFYGKS